MGSIDCVGGRGTCNSSWYILRENGLDQRAIEGDAWNPLVDEACTPVDMKLLVIRSIRISSTDFSTVLRSLEIHTRDQISGR
jgi:hypothetical protein